MIFSFLIFLLLQSQPPLKAARDFEIATNYELRKKPFADNNRIVLDQALEKEKSSGTDMLPYLFLKLKVKKWASGVDQIKVTDSQNNIHLKKKPNDDGLYIIDMGYVDDMKDKVSSGKYFVLFLKDKKPLEQITIEVEADGTFLVNGERRGKF